MGKKQSKPFKKVMISKSKFELTLKKVGMHVKLQRDRRMGVLRKKEKQLLQLLNRKARNQKDEYIKGSSIVSDQSFVDACNITLRFIDILKDKSINIVESKGDHCKISEIVPYLISVLWVGKPLNIPVFGELYNMMFNFFGPGVKVCLEQEQQVDAELKCLFKNLMPTPQQVNLYFRQFCDKYDLDVVKFNSVGHQAPCGDVYQNCAPSYPGAQFGNGGGMGGMGGQAPQGGLPMGPVQGQMGNLPPQQMGQVPQQNFLPMPDIGRQAIPQQQQAPGPQMFPQPTNAFGAPPGPQQPMGGPGPQQQQPLPDFDLNNMQKFDDVPPPGQNGDFQWKNDNDMFADIDNLLKDQNQNQPGGQPGQNNFNNMNNMQYPNTGDLPQPGPSQPYQPTQPGAFPPPTM